MVDFTDKNIEGFEYDKKFTSCQSLSYFSGMSIVTFYTYVENNNIILSKLEKKIDDIENNDENIELNINLKNENDDDKEDDKEDDKDDDKDDDDEKDDEKDDTKRYKSNYDME